MGSQGSNTASYPNFEMDAATLLGFQNADQSSTFPLDTPVTARNYTGNGQSPRNRAAEEGYDGDGLDIVQAGTTELPESSVDEDTPAAKAAEARKNPGNRVNDATEAPIPDPFAAEPLIPSQPEDTAGSFWPSYSQATRESGIGQSSIDCYSQPQNFDDNSFTAEQPKWANPRNSVPAHGAPGWNEYQAQAFQSFDPSSRPRHSNLHVPRTGPPDNQARAQNPYLGYNTTAEADRTSYIPSFDHGMPAGLSLTNARKRPRGVNERDEEQTYASDHTLYEDATSGTRVAPYATDTNYLGRRAEIGDPDIEPGAAEKRRRLANGQASHEVAIREDNKEDDFPQDEEVQHSYNNGSFGHNPVVPPYSTVQAPTTAGTSTGTRRVGRRTARGNYGVIGRPYSDGNLYFQANGSQTWEPTRKHEEMRRPMIDHMAQMGEYGLITDCPQPARGQHPDDLTSFHPTHHNWRFEGHQGWHNSQDALLYRFERRGLQDPDYLPRPLRFQGFVILSSSDQVITDWRDLPLTLSSLIEGGRMENIQRLDSRITVQDFQDRMPATKRSALTNRMGRFRMNNGLASWNCRDRSDSYKKVMLTHLDASQLRQNTTRGYDGLTAAEKKKIEEDNKASGKYNARAGKNAKR